MKKQFLGKNKIQRATNRRSFSATKDGDETEAAQVSVANYPKLQFKASNVNMLEIEKRPQGPMSFSTIDAVTHSDIDSHVEANQCKCLMNGVGYLSLQAAIEAAEALGEKNNALVCNGGDETVDVEILLPLAVISLTSSLVFAPPSVPNSKPIRICLKGQKEGLNSISPAINPTPKGENCLKKTRIVLDNTNNGDSGQRQNVGFLVGSGANASFVDIDVDFLHNVNSPQTKTKATESHETEVKFILVAPKGKLELSRCRFLVKKLDINNSRNYKRLKTVSGSHPDAEDSTLNVCRDLENNDGFKHRVPTIDIEGALLMNEVTFSDIRLRFDPGSHVNCTKAEISFSPLWSSSSVGNGLCMAGENVFKDTIFRRTPIQIQNIETRATLTKCNILECTHALLIENDAKITSHETKMEGSSLLQGPGLLFRGNAKGTFVDCTFSNFTGGALQIQSNSTVEMSHCAMSGVQAYALNIDGKGSGVVAQSCQIHCESKGLGSVILDNGGSVILDKVSIVGASSAAVRIKHPAESNAYLRNCGLFQNNIGVAIDSPDLITFSNGSPTSGKLWIDGCTFLSTKENSIHIDEVIEWSKEHRNYNSRPLSTSLTLDGFTMRMRWNNFIENGEICNRMMIFETCSAENFYGAFEFESLLYIDLLVNRLKRAQSFFEMSTSGAETTMSVREIFGIDIISESSMKSNPTLFDDTYDSTTLTESVAGIMKLIPGLSETVLEAVLDYPDLGMFLAKYDPPIIEVETLLKSWENIQRAQTFDFAFKVLDSEYFRHSSTHMSNNNIVGQNEQNDKNLGGAMVKSLPSNLIPEDLYEKWRTRLEEFQKECFGGSKYHRRREYLHSAARENPLASWYFLSSERVKVLQEEVLRILAAPNPDDRPLNQGGFDSSWVAEWAIIELGERFIQEDPSPIGSQYIYIHRAWCNALLNTGEVKNAERVIMSYEETEVESTDGNMISKAFRARFDEDKLLLYEAYQMRGDEEDQQKMISLFPNGFPGAVAVAGRRFRGEGVLPGFLRRHAEKAIDPESLLSDLSHFYVSHVTLLENKDEEMNSFVDVRKTAPMNCNKLETVTAVMAHFFKSDLLSQPTIFHAQKTVFFSPSTRQSLSDENNYTMCGMCLSQLLQPWNELKLTCCDKGHHFCRNCMKTSLTTPGTLWGQCPGINCDVMATRRDLELAGVDREKIQNILTKYVTKGLRDASRLKSIDAAKTGPHSQGAFESRREWFPCNIPGCIGGKYDVEGRYFTCTLCCTIVSLDDSGTYDPAIEKRLLLGLARSSAVRGEGLYRECYHCAVLFEKGDACSTMTCSNCKNNFNLTLGPQKLDEHRFESDGIDQQRYVPKVEGRLWKLGVFTGFKLGQTLNKEESDIVLEQARKILCKFEEI